MGEFANFVPLHLQRLTDGEGSMQRLLMALSTSLSTNTKGAVAAIKQFEQEDLPNFLVLPGMQAFSSFSFSACKGEEYQTRPHAVVSALCLSLCQFL